MQGPSKFVLGALLMAGAALTFSAMHALIRLAALEVHPFEVAFLRWFFGGLFLLPMIVRAGPKVWRTPHLKLHMGRAVVTMAGTVVWFYALTVLPLAQATALNFTIPLFTTVGAAFFLSEHVGPRRWSATAIGFLGVLVILRPGITDISSASLLPIAAAVMVAFNLNVVKYVGRTDSTLTIVALNAAFATPLTAIPMLFFWQTPSLDVLILTAIIGGSATFAHVLFTKAFSYGDASALIPIDYLRLPFVAAIGYFAFGEVPDAWTWIGGAVIAGATIYIAHRESRLTRQRSDVTETAAARAKDTS